RLDRACLPDQHRLGLGGREPIAVAEQAGRCRDARPEQRDQRPRNEREPNRTSPRAEAIALECTAITPRTICVFDHSDASARGQGYLQCRATLARIPEIRDFEPNITKILLAS